MPVLGQGIASPTPGRCATSYTTDAIDIAVEGTYFNIICYDTVWVERIEPITFPTHEQTQLLLTLHSYSKNLAIFVAIETIVISKIPMVHRLSETGVHLKENRGSIVIARPLFESLSCVCGNVLRLFWARASPLILMILMSRI